MAMAALRKVSFRFSTDTQIRYVERSPRRGDRIEGLDGELYVVLHSDQTGSGDVAICVTPLEYHRATELRARAIHALTSPGSPRGNPRATPSPARARGESRRA
jgi:hypothetical protein